MATIATGEARCARPGCTFPIEHLWNVDRAISADMLTIMGYLAEQPSAVYADAFGHGNTIGSLIEKWRTKLPV